MARKEEFYLGPDIIWEDTGFIIPHENYVQRLYVEHKKNMLPKLIAGEPIQKSSMSTECLLLTNILTNANAALFKMLDREEHLELSKTKNNE